MERLRGRSSPMEGIMDEALELLVITRDTKTGAVESRKTINHNDRDDRVWLGKHCFWAFRNGRSVETIAKSDAMSAVREGY